MLVQRSRREAVAHRRAPSLEAPLCPPLSSLDQGSFAKPCSRFTSYNTEDCEEVRSCFISPSSGQILQDIQNFAKSNLVITRK